MLLDLYFSSKRIQRTVLPAKITLAPVFNPVRRIVELAGAEMLDSIMLEHEATADVIWA